MWKSIADFLINKLGGVTKEDHEAALMDERQIVHVERRPVQTTTVFAEARWQHEGIGTYERECLAKKLGARLLEEGLIHFDVGTMPDIRDPFPITYARATIRVVVPSSQGFGYEVEGFFIDEDLIHVQHK